MPILRHDLEHALLEGVAVAVLGLGPPGPRSSASATPRPGRGGGRWRRRRSRAGRRRWTSTGSPVSTTTLVRVGQAARAISRWCTAPTASSDGTGPGSGARSRAVGDDERGRRRRARRPRLVAEALARRPAARPGPRPPGRWRRAHCGHEPEGRVARGRPARRGEEEASQLQQPGRLGLLAEQRAGGGRAACAGHHMALAQVVDGRVGDLGEALAQEVVRPAGRSARATAAGACRRPSRTSAPCRRWPSAAAPWYQLLW